MASLGAERREARLFAEYDENEIISDRAYNIVLGGTVLWGIVINVILCMTVGDVYQYISPLAFFILYLVLCIAGVFMSAKSSNPIISFIGYNMVVVPLGLLISTLVDYYGGVSSSVVGYAFVYTALITGIMIILSILFPNFFAKLGGMLFGCLIGIVVAELIMMLLGLSNYVSSYFAAIIFSVYIGYDVYRSQQFAKTVDNAIDCALDIYLDIANLFVRILQILGRRSE